MVQALQGEIAKHQLNLPEPGFAFTWAGDGAEESFDSFASETSSKFPIRSK